LKKSFALLLSIAFVLVMAFIGMMVMRFSSASSVHVRESYMDVRANLALRSATEYAILALQGHDFSSGRVNSIHIDYPMFEANVKFHYFLTDCDGSSDCSTIDTADTNGSVLVYVEVVSKNPNNRVRKYRVTLQNP